MLKSSARSVIRLRGVRQNNLKNLDLDLPLNRLIVITGLSGSGKSSLAFDTLFAEGQRRYIETFSPYARQFFDRMDKPQVDTIEGIPPAIAIEQRNSVRTTRSTVGTMTEICDYMKTLWPHVAELYCRQCGRPVRKDSPETIWRELRNGATEPPAKKAGDVLVTFELPLSEKLTLEESLSLVAKQGYQRLWLGNEVVRLDEALPRFKSKSARSSALTVVQDRLSLNDTNRARFIEACEQAYHFGKGKLAIYPLASQPLAPRRFSDRRHCAPCDLEYREPSSALFSFNHPVGACPTCRGFGRVISIDYERVMPARSKTLAQGVVKPWQTGQSAECQSDLLRACRHFEIPTDVPFEKLPEKWQRFVIDGEPGYGKDEEHQWPRAWYGVKGYFRWLESKAYRMHVRVLLSRYRAYTPCPDCDGKRFQPEALLYRVASLESDLTLADFYQLPIRDALRFVGQLEQKPEVHQQEPLRLVLNEIGSRLRFLNEVGLGYLTLDRPTRSLSGGETERVNLTTCLGTRLVNTLFVLDEPSVGLHPRDTQRLVGILEQLRNAGNTVVVVEHEASVMRAADQIIDLGPGHGAAGGHLVFQGSFAEICKSVDSLTGQYLSGRKQIEVPQRRPVLLETSARAAPTSGPSYRGLTATALHEASVRFGAHPSAVLTLSHAARHNLRNLTLQIPLNRFVCVTGVSGSGKTTLVREVLLPALTARLRSAAPISKASDRLDAESEGAGIGSAQPDQSEDESGPEGETSSYGRPATVTGWEQLNRVVLVDQSILGKTPRSNPAVYIGAFDDIREVYAQSGLAKQRGLNASAFSFNSSQGQCERCRGAGFEKIEMQFLSDVFIRCPECNGSRYRAHIMDIRISPETRPSGAAQKPAALAGRSGSRGLNGAKSSDLPPLSIAELLDRTVEEAIAFLTAFRDSRPARRAVDSLNLLQEVGLGYLKLGQPINTLSGGESQRLKLVRHLAESPAVGATPPASLAPTEQRPAPASRRFNERAQLAAARASSPSMARSRMGNGGLAQSAAPGRTLFLFDEPTTGLHFDDVRVLLKVFHRLVDAGHSVVVIEHNLDVAKSADWLIDLGPDAGDEGGRLVAQGTPETLAAHPDSHTGRALRDVLPSVRRQPARVKS